jgi:hypothetical protein
MTVFALSAFSGSNLQPRKGFARLSAGVSPIRLWDWSMPPPTRGLERYVKMVAATPALNRGERVASA